MIVSQAFFAALEPPPDLTVSQWADAHRMLSAEASAEPGQWDTARAPYQRGLMDAIHDPLVETVVMETSSQVGKTEVLLNICGYHIDLDPAPIIFGQPTLEMAQAFSKDRLDTMIRDTPVLAAKVPRSRRTSGNTILHKTYPGGHVTLIGSNSTAGLASRPIRIVLADEIDRWEVTKEGDPLALLAKRTTTFWNRKHVLASTPGIKGQSRIEARFEESDKRQCYVPCPHCGARHVIEWKNVKWEKDEDGRDLPETAHLVCPECGAEVDEGGRAQMLRDPEWRATAAFQGIAGYHIWEGYSPWRRLADIVADFLEAKKSPDTLQVFVNTVLGETWEERGEQAEGHVLLARREPYPAAVPAGACCLTMGVDVQDDRLEGLVIGWGPGEESWVIDARVLPGDPQRPEPWQALDEMLAAGYRHESGAQLQVAAACIDTRGHRTSYVYDYVGKRQHQRVYAIIGMAGADEPIVSAPKRKRSGRDPRKVDLYAVGTDQCKSLIYSRLKVTERGPGFIHLPLAHQAGDEYRAGVDEEFVAQLTAEKLVTRHKMGVPMRLWVQIRPRNEALDCFVYAIGALRLLRPDLAALARKLGAPTPPTPPPPTSARKTWLQPRPGWLRGGRSRWPTSKT